MEGFENLSSLGSGKHLSGDFSLIEVLLPILAWGRTTQNTMCGFQQSPALIDDVAKKQYCFTANFINLRAF